MRVEDAVGGGHEAEGRGEHQVSLAHAGREHAEVEPRGPAAHAHGVPRAHAGRQLALEEIELGTEAQDGGAQNLLHRRPLGLGEVGLTHGNSHGRFL